MPGSRPFSWRDRYPEQVTCVRCLEVRDTSDLDRLLWCEDCRESARARSRAIGWAGGVLVAIAVSIYIWFWIRPTDLIPQLWLAIPVATIWLGGRVVSEIAYGVMQFRNSRAVEAVPPSVPPESGEEGPAAPPSG